MTRRLLALAMLAALTAGCGKGSALGYDLHPETVDLPDGRTVTCVRLADGYAGGLSCDWGNQ